MSKKVKEIVVLSGKGGTGKTTLTASLVPYLEDLVVADCDVDAADLDILLDPVMDSREDFVGTVKASIDADTCIRCGKCVKACRFDAISEEFQVIDHRCEGCGVCYEVCPAGSVSLTDRVVGEIRSSHTSYGPMVQGRLIPGEETSGKLVSAIRNKGKEKARQEGKKYLLIDGSPGIGCSVISSVTGADQVVMVTEPTLSGLHDLERVSQLISGFGIPMVLIINKWDLNREITSQIESWAEGEGIQDCFRNPYQEEVLQAVINRKIPSRVLGLEKMPIINAILERIKEE